MVQVIERPVAPQALPQVQHSSHTVRSILEQRGWCQGTYENRRGNVCLMEAINIVHGYRHGSAIRTLVRIHMGMNIMAWNDAPGRTLEEVLEVADQIDSWLAEHLQEQRCT